MHLPLLLLSAVVAAWAAPTVVVQQPVKSIQYAPVVRTVQTYSLPVQPLPVQVAQPVKSAYTYSAPLALPVQAKSYSYIQPVQLVAPISTQYHAQDELGQYSYGYSNPDGHSKAEVKGVDGTVVGRYSYIDPTGKQVQVAYVADDNGFRVAANNLPVAPELPPELEAAYEEAKERYAAEKNRNELIRARTAAKNAVFLPAPVPVPVVRDPVSPVAVPVPVPVKSSSLVYSAPVYAPAPVAYAAPAKKSSYSYAVAAPTPVFAPAPVVLPAPVPVQAQPVKSSSFAYSVAAPTPVVAAPAPIAVQAQPVKSSSFAYSVAAPTPVVAAPAPVVVPAPAPVPVQPAQPASFSYSVAAETPIGPKSGYSYTGPIEQPAAVIAPAPVLAPAPIALAAPAKTSSYSYSVQTSVPAVPAPAPVLLPAQPVKSSSYAYSVPTPVALNPAPLALSAAVPAKSGYTY